MVLFILLIHYHPSRYVCLEAKTERYMFVPCGDPSISHLTAVPYGPVCALLQDT